MRVYSFSIEERERERERESPVSSAVRLQNQVDQRHQNQKYDACGGGGSGPFDKGAGSEELEVEHLLQSPSIEYHRCGTYVIVVTLREHAPAL